MENHRLKTVRDVLLLLLIPAVSTSQNFTTSTWESLGPEGGYLTTLAQNPVNGDLYSVTYDYPARVFKSTNNGDTWTSFSEIPDNISYLIVDPQKPENMYASYSYLGYGTNLDIYKSANGGLTWTRILFAGESNSYYYAYEFTIDKTNPNKLSLVGYCEKWNGSAYIYRPYTFKSTDGGATWTVKHYDNVTQDVFYAFCSETDPSDPNIWYIGGYVVKTNSYFGKVFKTTNNGTTWTDITGTTLQGYVYDLLVDPSSPNKLYAVSYAGVFRSTDKGATWQRNYGSAWGSKLLFDPKNYSTIYAYSSGISCFRSTDGGQTWSDLSKGLSGGNCNELVVNASSSSTLYVVTRAGCFRSSDGGKNWTSTNRGILCSYIPTLKCLPSSPSSLVISVLYCGLYKTSNALGKGSPAAITGVTWDKLPEYSYCEGVLKMELDGADPNVLYIQEGAG